MEEPRPKDDEQPIVSALHAHQKEHEMRMERLLERHLEQVTQMLSVAVAEAAGGGQESPKYQPPGLSAIFFDADPSELARGVPEHPKQPPASAPATFFDADPVVLASGAPHRPKQPPASLSASFVDAEVQVALPVEDDGGHDRSESIVDAGAAKPLEPQSEAPVDTHDSEPRDCPKNDSRPVGLNVKSLTHPFELSSWMHKAGMSMCSMAQLERFIKEDPPPQDLLRHDASTRSGRTAGMAVMITRHKGFEYFFQGLILANAVIMGVEQDWQARHIGQDLPSSYFYVDLMFGSCFLIELVLRILASGSRFFSLWNRDIKWNIFDTLLVLSAIVEVALKLSTDRIAFDVSTGRLLRLMRLVRIVRVVRIFRFFKDLRVMVLSVLGCMRPLVFALVLLFILIYVFAVCLLQFVNEELASLSWTQGGRELDHFRLLTFNYGSLGRTTYTLFLSISNGVSWGEACEPLFGISWWVGFLYVMYIAFCMFCVLNIITGIFVEEASAMAAVDEENMMFHEMQKRQRFVAQVKKFFVEADKDGSGQLSWEEFSERLQHVRVQKLLENLGIDVVSTGARNVFELFDYDGNNSIGIGEFTSALIQMRGTARSIDLASLRQETRKLRRDVTAILKHVTGEEACGGAQRPERGQSASPCVAGRSTRRTIAEEARRSA